MTDFTLHDVVWAAEECERQRSGEQSVAWMLEALRLARNLYDDISGVTTALIVTLGATVEPAKNRNGLRTRQVFIARDGDIVAELPEPMAVPGLLSRLVEHGSRLTAAGWFKEFEEIHPFIDGNGRTGAILYNCLNGTLNDPETAPDFWNPDHDNYWETPAAMEAS